MLGTRKDNAADYTARKNNPLGPLADRRGPAGRARAIRGAILRAQAHGADREAVEKGHQACDGRGHARHPRPAFLKAPPPKNPRLSAHFPPANYGRVRGE
jgi:hypothetical protein